MTKPILQIKEEQSFNLKYIAEKFGNKIFLKMTFTILSKKQGSFAAAFCIELLESPGHSSRCP